MVFLALYDIIHKTDKNELRALLGGVSPPPPPGSRLWVPDSLTVLSTSFFPRVHISHTYFLFASRCALTRGTSPFPQMKDGEGTTLPSATA